MQAQMAQIQGQAAQALGTVESQAALASMPTSAGPGPQFSTIGGQQQQQAYDVQAQDLGQEASLALEYGQEQINQNNFNTTKFQATQEAQFSASGVTISGSPLGVLTETAVQGAQVSTMIGQQSQEQAMLYSDQGLQALRSGSFANFSGQASADLANYNFTLQQTQAKNQADITQYQGNEAGYVGNKSQQLGTEGAIGGFALGVGGGLASALLKP